MRDRRGQIYTNNNGSSCAPMASFYRIETGLTAKGPQTAENLSGLTNTYRGSPSVHHSLLPLDSGGKIKITMLDIGPDICAPP